MSASGKLFEWCLAFLSRRPVRSGNFRPFCGPVPSASGHVSLQDLTEALMRQIRPAQWLPLVEVAPRAGYWLMAWASFWAAETSLPQTLHQQGPSSGTSCLTGLTPICQRKETVTKFLPCSLKKKITRTFFFGSHTQSPAFIFMLYYKCHESLNINVFIMRPYIFLLYWAP